MHTQRLFKQVGLAALLLLGAGSATAATVVYSYTGNDLAGFSSITNPCTPLDAGCGITNISAEIVLSTELGADAAFGAVTATSWSISDGLTTVTDLTPGYNFTFALSAGTNASGDIDEWWFQLVAAPAATTAGQHSQIRSRNFSGTTDDQTDYCQTANSSSCTFNGVANTVGNAGAWTTTVVPIPAALWLFASGLLLISRLRSKR